MLYNDQAVAKIPEVFEGIQQFIIISLMQADTWLIQDIAYTHKSGSDLGCQTDSLCLSAGKSTCCPGKRQIVQSHIDQEADSCTDLLKHLAADQHLLLCEL